MDSPASASRTPRRPFVGGNWKMNTTRAAAIELARAVAAGVDGASAGGRSAEVVVCPPFPWLLAVAEALRGSSVRLGAQDLSSEPSGAFTGQVSAEMILDAGAQVVIIGHSERRHGLGESDAVGGEKLVMALESGLDAIFCVGETWAEREAGRAHEVTERQLAAGFEHVDRRSAARVVIAYEPVWAIGTGRSATPRDAQEAHASVRRWLASRYDAPFADGTRILYGGSVTAANASSLFEQPDVDGGLIGGASLKPAEFLGIVVASVQAKRRTATA